MTNLTEQWEKGELPEGWYWCECYNEEIKKLYYDGDCFELDDPETKNYYFFIKKDCAEIEILGEVPSYEEWQASENYIDYLKQCISVYESKDKQATETSIAYNELAEENEELKELLKDCREILDYAKDFAYHNPCCKCINKINQVLGEE